MMTWKELLVIVAAVLGFGFAVTTACRAQIAIWAEEERQRAAALWNGPCADEVLYTARRCPNKRHVLELHCQQAEEAALLCRCKP